ncbi:MAG: BrnT family toxin [Chloroflexota bacterium]|nr:BrnT family toxin [Chloroflexota bacterium]
MVPRNVEFEWSVTKAVSNLKKHGVSFEEAETAFDDTFAYIFDDEWHSAEEPREILIGYSDRNRLLFVSFVQRASEHIRIISARVADQKEHEDYEENPRRGA